jgi:hypothetical protein
MYTSSKHNCNFNINHTKKSHCCTNKQWKREITTKNTKWKKYIKNLKNYITFKTPHPLENTKKQKKQHSI